MHPSQDAGRGRSFFFLSQYPSPLFFEVLSKEVLSNSESRTFSLLLNGG